MPSLLPGRVGASQFAIIMRYSIVAKITLNADANTRRVHALTGVFLPVSTKPLFCHFTSLFIKYFADVRIVRLEKLHVAKTHDRRQGASKGFYYEGTLYFLAAILCFSSVSRAEGAILKRQAKNSIDWRRGTGKSGFTLLDCCLEQKPFPQDISRSSPIFHREPRNPEQGSS